MSKTRTIEEAETWGVLRYGRPPDIGTDVINRSNWLRGIEPELLIESHLGHWDRTLGIMIIPVETIMSPDWRIFKRISEAHERINKRGR